MSLFPLYYGKSCIGDFPAGSRLYRPRDYEPGRWPCWVEFPDGTWRGFSSPDRPPIEMSWTEQEIANNRRAMALMQVAGDTAAILEAAERFLPQSLEDLQTLVQVRLSVEAVPESPLALMAMLAEVPLGWRKLRAGRPDWVVPSEDHEAHWRWRIFKSTGPGWRLVENAGGLHHDIFGTIREAMERAEERT